MNTNNKELYLELDEDIWQLLTLVREIRLDNMTGNYNIFTLFEEFLFFIILFQFHVNFDNYQP